MAKRTTKRKTPGGRDPAAKATAIRGTERHTVPLTRIVTSAFQTRDLKQAKIAELADSIRQQGLLQPPIVRRYPGDRTKFELLDGERRLRACMFLGYREIPVELRAECDDKTAREILWRANADREDVDPVGEAQQFAKMLDFGDAKGPTELAKQLGVSQGHVSNRLRLLTLPKPVQERLISGEIGPGPARCLIQLRDHPELLERLVNKVIGPPTRPRKERLTGDQFEDRFYDELRQATEQPHYTRFSSKLGEYVPKPKMTEDLRRRLGVVKIDEGGRGRRRPGSRAPQGPREYEVITNKKAWKEVLDQEEALALKRRENKAKAKPKKPAGKMTAAQRKAAERQERELAAKRRQQYQTGLWRWWVNWLRYLIGEALRNDATPNQVTAVVLATAGYWDDRRYDPGENRMTSFNRRAWLGDAAIGTGIKLGSNVPESLFDMADGGIEDLAVHAAAACFFRPGDEGGPNPLVPDRDVVTVAKALEIDTEAAWLNNQAGPLSEAFWQLHNKEDLADLAKELKVEVPKGAKKTALVQAFLARIPKPEDKEVGIDLPKVLKKVKRPKGGRWEWS